MSYKKYRIARQAGAAPLIPTRLENLDESFDLVLTGAPGSPHLRQLSDKYLEDGRSISTHFCDQQADIKFPVALVARGVPVVSRGDSCVPLIQPHPVVGV